MSAPHEGQDPRHTDLFWVALSELENDANVHRFEGAGSFYAWERLNRLIGRLRAAFDLYELEADAAPMHAEIADFFADLDRLHIRPDQWVSGHLSKLGTALERLPLVTLTTATERPAPGAHWPEDYLVVRPGELEALMLRDRLPPSSTL